MPERKFLGKLMRLRMSVSAAEEYLGSYFYELMKVCRQVFRSAGEELTREQWEEFQKWNPGVDWVGEGVRRRRGRALVREGGSPGKISEGFTGLQGSLIIIFIIFILGVPLPLLSFGWRRVLVCRGEARFKNNTNKQTCLCLLFFLINSVTHKMLWDTTIKYYIFFIFIFFIFFRWRNI